MTTSPALTNQIALPATSVEMLAGRHEAQQIVEAVSAAFWMFAQDQDTALFLLQRVHADFAELAKALGYDVTRRNAALTAPPVPA